jgi:hypothetical protein
MGCGQRSQRPGTITPCARADRLAPASKNRNETNNKADFFKRMTLSSKGFDRVSDARGFAS